MRCYARSRLSSSAVDRTNHAPAIHEEAGRQRGCLVSPADLAIPIEQRWKGQLIVADAPIETVADLKGKIVAVGAVDSPQATLIPLNELRARGVMPGVDVEVQRHDVLGGKHGDLSAANSKVYGRCWRGQPTRPA
jgi:hypothetical protein